MMLWRVSWSRKESGIKASGDTEKASGDTERDYLPPLPMYLPTTITMYYSHSETPLMGSLPLSHEKQSGSEG